MGACAATLSAGGPSCLSELAYPAPASAVRLRTMRVELAGAGAHAGSGRGGKPDSRACRSTDILPLGTRLDRTAGNVRTACLMSARAWGRLRLTPCAGTLKRGAGGRESRTPAPAPQGPPTVGRGASRWAYTIGRSGPHHRRAVGSKARKAAAARHASDAAAQTPPSASLVPDHPYTEGTCAWVELGQDVEKNQRGAALGNIRTSIVHSPQPIRPRMATLTSRPRPPRR